MNGDEIAKETAEAMGISPEILTELRRRASAKCLGYHPEMVGNVKVTDSENDDLTYIVSVCVQVHKPETGFLKLYGS